MKKRKMVYTSSQPYKFGNKELDIQRGLNWYDFEKRQMDPVVPGFTTPDPLMEKYYSWSPYAYCLNNPIKLIDPDGKAAQIPPIFGVNPPLLGTSNPLVAGGRNIGMLGSSDKIVRSLPKEDHHLIPRSLSSEKSRKSRI